MRVRKIWVFTLDKHMQEERADRLITKGDKRGPVVFLSGKNENTSFLIQTIMSYLHLRNMYVIVRNELQARVKNPDLSENERAVLDDMLGYLSNELVIRALFQEEKPAAQFKRRETRLRNALQQLSQDASLNDEEKERGRQILMNPKSSEELIDEQIALVQASSKTEAQKAKALAKLQRRKEQKLFSIREQEQALRAFLAEHKIFQEFLTLGANLKSHVIRNVIKSINIAYINAAIRAKETGRYFPPQAEKLDRVSDFFVDLCELSFRRKGSTILINLAKKMLPFSLSQNIARRIPALKTAKVTKVGIVKGQLAVVLCYEKTPPIPLNTDKKAPKFAGLDLGLKNLASLFIDDEETPSILLQGRHLLRINALFNEANAIANEQLTPIQQRICTLRRSPTGYLPHQILLTKNPEYQQLYLQSSLLRVAHNQRFLARRNVMLDFFHKAAVRILEYLSEAQVTDLVISRNLGHLKNQKGPKGNRDHNRRFIGLPLLKILDYIEINSPYFGVKCHHIDEAYTSKTSCLTGDVVAIQKTFPKKLLLEKEKRAEITKPSSPCGTTLGGRRNKGAFTLSESRTYIHADINAAVNHIRVYGREIDWTARKRLKLHQPLRVKLNTTLYQHTDSQGNKKLFERNVIDKHYGIGRYVQRKLGRSNSLPLAAGKTRMAHLVQQVVLREPPSTS